MAKPRLLKVFIVSLSLLLLSGCDVAPTSSQSPDKENNSSSGFAGLGASNQGYAQASTENTLSFPLDHGPHPDFRIEWWYLTANLVDEQDQPLGLQWTLFRQAQQPPTTKPKPTAAWDAQQLWMAHIALSRGKQHRVAERFARGSNQVNSKSQAGVIAQPFRAWLDNWQLNSLNAFANADALDHLLLSAQATDKLGSFGYKIELTAEGPLVYHGVAGFSQKSADGQGSMYYSQPFYRVNGEVMLNDETIKVSGQAWLDREWSSQLLGAHQTGWDWFSLHLNSGARLMAFRLRGGGNHNTDYISGSWITPNGQLQPLGASDITLEPLDWAKVDGHNVPFRWRLTLAEQGLTLIVTAPETNRWMDTSVPYWEGAVNVTDANTEQAIGQGYLEMTGY